MHTAFSAELMSNSEQMNVLDLTMSNRQSCLDKRKITGCYT
jgi:hypothetical protein